MQKATQNPKDDVNKGHQQRKVRPKARTTVDHRSATGITLRLQGHHEIRKADSVVALKPMRGLTCR